MMAANGRGRDSGKGKGQRHMRYFPTYWRRSLRQIERNPTREARIVPARRELKAVRGHPRHPSKVTPGAPYQGLG